MLKVKKMSNPTKIIKLVEHSHKTEPYVGLVNEDLEDLRETYIGDCLIATHAVNDNDDELLDAIDNARDNNDLDALEEILPGCLSDESFLEEITSPGRLHVRSIRMKPVDGIDYETVEREIA